MVTRSGGIPADVGDRHLPDWGEPLPELETAAHGDPDGLVADLLEASEELGVDARTVPPEAWEHGDARGVCKRRSPSTTNTVVVVVDRENRADLASTLIYEFAHAELHFGCDEVPEWASLEVEAEAVAYIVSRHFGLDADNAAFYLAAWDGEAAETVETGWIVSHGQRVVSSLRLRRS